MTKTIRQGIVIVQAFKNKPLNNIDIFHSLEQHVIRVSFGHLPLQNKNPKDH